jgi:hypothetical protein
MCNSARGWKIMAGSNGSPSQRGGQDAQWVRENEERARAAEFERWQLQQHQHGGHPAAPPHHAQGAGHPPPHPNDFGHAPPGYPPAQAAYPDPSTGRQPSYAPQFERFNPPPDPHDPYARHAAPPAQFGRGEPSLIDPHAGHHAGDVHGYDPMRGGPAHDPRHTPQGWPPSHGQPPAGYPDHDPRAAAHGGRGEHQSWDLSHYQTGQIPDGYGQPQPSQAYQPASAPPGWPPAPQPHGHDPQWGQPQPGQWHGQPPAPGYGDHGHPGYGQPHLDPALAARDPQHGEAGYDQDDYEAAEPERRSPSTLMIVGALVGAIALGGGLAFAYKQFGGGASNTAKIAEVRSPGSPIKERPSDPGGRTIEHSDKKFLNRLPSDGSSSGDRQGASDVEGSAKKVATIPIVVNRDGQTAAAGEGRVMVPTSGVPGLVLDGLGPPPGPPPLRGASGPQGSPQAPPRAALPPPPVTINAEAPPTPPRVADLPLPRVTNSAPPPAADRAPPARTKAAAVRDDFAAPQGGDAAARAGLGAGAAPPRRPAASTSSSGYVAVLASKKSRQDALNSFADLHSQYPDVLAGVTPDVKEANLGDKGVWYRLIAGPPGSREAARTLCVKLKEKGMKDCWPVAF